MLYHIIKIGEMVYLDGKQVVDAEGSRFYVSERKGVKFQIDENASWFILEAYRLETIWYPLKIVHSYDKRWNESGKNLHFWCPICGEKVSVKNDTYLNECPIMTKDADELFYELLTTKHKDRLKFLFEFPNSV